MTRPAFFSLCLRAAVVCAFFASAACVDEVYEHAGDPVAVSLPFAATVNGADFACDGVYENVGTGDATFSPKDARLYVHNVRLVAGDEVRGVALTDDDEFQGEGVALLDFEDDTGTCETGSTRTHTTLTGTAASLTDVTALRFTVGVPVEQNHLDAATAAPPLNDPGMFWAWSSGYKHMKVEGATPNKDTVYFHLGAQTCAGDPGSFTCAHENTVDVSVPYTIGDTVTVDIGALFAGIDVDAPLADGDGIDGCMSFDGDPECVPMYGAVGLSFEGSTAPAQSVFGVR